MLNLLRICLKSKLLPGITYSSLVVANCHNLAFSDLDHDQKRNLY